MKTAGYSATPLIRKLGFKPHSRIALVDAPDDYESWLGPLPEGAATIRSAAVPDETGIAAAHAFVDDAARLAALLGRFREALADDGFLWVSWPKKSSKVPTDVTEDTIRALALPLGLVDVKVCAVTEIWSGLKLVIRRTERRR